MIQIEHVSKRYGATLAVDDEGMRQAVRVLVAVPIRLTFRPQSGERHAIGEQAP